MRYRALAPRHIAARAQSFHRVGAVDRLVYDEQLNAFRNQLSSEDATKLDRLLAGECFRGRKKMIRELKFWMVDFDPYNEDD